MKFFARTLALGTVAVLSLTGCFHTEINVDLQSDDSADVEVVAGLSQEALEEVGPGGLSGLVNPDDYGDDVVTEEYVSEELDEDGNPRFEGSRWLMRDQSFEDVAMVVGDVTVVREDGDYVVDGAAVDLAAETEGQGLPEGSEFFLSFTFPGEVTSHNGVLDGKTVTWDLTEHTDSFQARGGAEGGFPSWLILVILGLVGVGIGMAIVLVSSGKRKPSDDLDQGDYLEGDAGIQGTVNTDDAGEGTVAAAPEPVVDADEVVDTTDDEDPERA